MITTKCLKIEIIIMRHKRLAKFTLIKYRINLLNDGIMLRLQNIHLLKIWVCYITQNWK